MVFIQKVTGKVVTSKLKKKKKVTLNDDIKEEIKNSKN